MDYTTLGSTGLRVSRLAFGAGPVAEVMIGDDSRRQQDLLRRALDAGINWIDTAASYGAGRAERALGQSLSALGAVGHVHVATKVRLLARDLSDIAAGVRASVAESQKRLGFNHLTLLQIHNSVTARRDDEPTSITPGDILDRGGVLEAFEQLRQEGVVRLVGITAIGQAGPLREVIGSGRFDTIQVPYSLVNPSAGQNVADTFQEADYGNVIHHAAQQKMGVFAIRVFAGGVLAGNPPAPHTLKTKFFTHDLFERDRLRVSRLSEMFADHPDLTELAVRFVFSQPDVSAAIIGFSEPKHIEQAVSHLAAGPLPDDLLARLRRLEFHKI